MTHGFSNSLSAMIAQWRLGLTTLKWSMRGGVVHFLDFQATLNTSITIWSGSCASVRSLLIPGVVLLRIFPFIYCISSRLSLLFLIFFLASFFSPSFVATVVLDDSQSSLPSGYLFSQNDLQYSSRE